MQNPLFNDPHPKTGWTPPGFDPTIGKSKIPTWRAETYKLAVFPYEGVYIGMPQIYYPTGPALPARNNTVGFHEIQLAFSRDAQLRRENWKRLGDREPFIETSGLDKGLAGNFDRQQIGVLNRPIVKQDELWFYYTGAKSRTPPYLLWPNGKPRRGADLTPEERADSKTAGSRSASRRCDSTDSSRSPPATNQVRLSPNHSLPLVIDCR